MKYLTAKAIIFLSCIFLASAQDMNIPELEVKITGEELLFGISAIQDVEIKGSEVDAYVDVNREFRPYIVQLQNGKTTSSDTLDLKVPLPVANNFLAFLERATIKGREAYKFKRLVNAFIEAAGKLEKKPDKPAD